MWWAGSTDTGQLICGVMTENTPASKGFLHVGMLLQVRQRRRNTIRAAEWVAESEGLSDGGLGLRRDSERLSRQQ